MNSVCTILNIVIDGRKYISPLPHSQELHILHNALTHSHTLLEGLQMTFQNGVIDMEESFR